MKNASACCRSITSTHGFGRFVMPIFSNHRWITSSPSSDSLADAEIFTLSRPAFHSSRQRGKKSIRLAGAGLSAVDPVCGVSRRVAFAAGCERATVTMATACSHMAPLRWFSGQLQNVSTCPASLLRILTFRFLVPPTIPLHSSSRMAASSTLPLRASAIPSFTALHPATFCSHVSDQSCTMFFVCREGFDCHAARLQGNSARA